MMNGVARPPDQGCDRGAEADCELALAGRLERRLGLLETKTVIGGDWRRCIDDDVSDGWQQWTARIGRPAIHWHWQLLAGG